MNEKNREYWQKRFSILNEHLLNRGDNYEKEVQQHYTCTVQEIQKEIEAFYQRFAVKNGISYSEAKKILNSEQRAAFQMTLKEYIKRGKENGADPKWIKKLENASTVYRMTRLKSLQLQIQQKMELLAASKQSEMKELFEGIYTDGYHQSIYEIQKGLGYGCSFSILDDRLINLALAKSYDADGSNFSQKIWKDRDYLVHTLDIEFTHMIIRGSSPDKLITSLVKKFNTSKKNVGTLVLTESAFLSSVAKKDCFQELGVAEYENIETLDGSTCEDCREMDGTHFPLSEFEPWTTAAPFHHRCRGTQAPYFNDEFTLNEKRTARAKDGKKYAVPSSMKYKEWKEKYVDAIK